MSFAITCPVAVQSSDSILLAHGEGARLTRRLIRQELLPAFANPFLEPLADGASLPQIGGDLVMTTDSSVVSPLFFPGATSASWRSTAPSTIWRSAAPCRCTSASLSFSRKACRWTCCAESSPA